ncbi:MAG: hypothetical protein ABIQ64_03735 [Candidatus Saccharimonadales bacterium]
MFLCADKGTENSWAASWRRELLTVLPWESAELAPLKQSSLLQGSTAHASRVTADAQTQIASATEEVRTAQRVLVTFAVQK